MKKLKVDNNIISKRLNIIFLFYFLGVILKKIFYFQDGLLDVFCIISLFLLMPEKKHSLYKLFKSRFFTLFILLLIYYLFLSQFSYNSLFNIVIEFFSVFKWLIYLLLGIAWGQQMESEITFPPLKSLMFFLKLIFIYSFFTYDFSKFTLSFSNFGNFYVNRIPSIFSLPSVFSLFSIVLFFYSVNLIKSKNRTSFFLLFSSLFFMFMSGSRKIFLALALSIFFINNIEFNRMLVVKFVKIIGIFFIVFFLQSQLFRYTIDEYSNLHQPRILALYISSLVAADYFPFGSGPGTLFSTSSIKEYSPLYRVYGLSNIWGFSEKSSIRFTNDTYWAQIIAQYGALGVLLIILILTLLYKELKKKEMHKLINYSSILIIIFILSFTTPTFQRIEIALLLFFPFGVAIAKNDEPPK